MGVDLVLREVDLDREWQSTVAVQAGRNEQVFFVATVDLPFSCVAFNLFFVLIMQ
jgi:hypothetical protein